MICHEVNFTFFVFKKKNKDAGLARRGRAGTSEPKRSRK